MTHLHELKLLLDPGNFLLTVLTDGRIRVWRVSEEGRLTVADHFQSQEERELADREGLPTPVVAEPQLPPLDDLFPRLKRVPRRWPNRPSASVRVRVFFERNMNSNRRDLGPYRSALDLPSVVEMLEFIRGAKALTRVIARDQRAKILRTETDIRRLSQLVDDFYALLGERHWIFHDRLNAEKLANLVRLPPDEAERALIELYKEPDALDFLVGPLFRFPALQARRRLIERAKTDYLDGRYYSVVLVLLAVMDGFVNDLNPQARRGLHARSPDEMRAWDSVVGHHLGLTNAHKTFAKGFRKISDEEVHELYRNGIMHGMLTNFDNDIVATKAWSRLFAVADWATSLERKAAPPKPKPTWRELFQQIRSNEEAKKALAAWKPRAVSEGDTDFADDPLKRLATDYLSAWQAKNYGKMAQLLSPLVREETEGRTAGMVRESCEGFDVTGFSVRHLHYQAAAVCEVDVELELQGENKLARMRWIRSGEDGMAATPNEPGEWFLISWGPWAMINNAQSAQ